MGRKAIGSIAVMAALLAACGTDVPTQRSAAQTRPAGAAIVPEGTFGPPAAEAPLPLVLEALPNVPSKKMLARASAVRTDPHAAILLYTSAASQRQLMQWGMDPATGTRLWENLLRAHSLRFNRASSPDDLDQAERARLLILPQTARLSQAERQAIARWRERGGAILSTWETGTYDESGKPAGTGFMESVLGIRPLDTPAFSADQRYLYPFGDGPVLWRLPAGLRIITESIARLPTRRLQGSQAAAVMSDWGRSHTAAAPAGTVIAFNEREASDLKSSRLVALGYAEQSWQRMDTGELSTLHTDVVHWLLRRPQAYVALWPHPYRSANVLALHGDVGATPAREAGTLADALGASLSVFSPLGRAEALLPPPLQDDWKAQQQRGWGLGWTVPAGTVPPGMPALTHGQRKTAIAPTQVRAWSPQGRFPDPGPTQPALDHLLLSIDADEARLPFPVAWSGGSSTAVGLPVTLTALDDAAAQQPTLAQWLDEWELVQRAAALSVVRLSLPHKLSPAQLETLTERSRKNRSQWLASSAEVAHWWRQRSKVQRAWFDYDDEDRPILVVRSREAVAPDTVVPVIVAMPSSTARLGLDAAHSPAGASVARIDAWRSVVLLRNLPQGDTRVRISITDRSQNP
ncbi:MAG: hypothetical protein ACT4NV_14010 [Rhodoferax sp.]